MTTYNTGNPLGSAAAKDLYDNAQNFDHLSNDRVNETWDDRFGKPRLTWHGIEVRYQEKLTSMGWSLIESFQDGATLTRADQALRWTLPDGDGEYYRWDGEFPKVVPSGSTPESTGGVGTGAWIGVGDAALRGGLVPASYSGLNFREERDKRIAALSTGTVRFCTWNIQGYYAVQVPEFDYDVASRQSIREHTEWYLRVGADFIGLQEVMYSVDSPDNALAMYPYISSYIGTSYWTHEKYGDVAISTRQQQNSSHVIMREAIPGVDSGNQYLRTEIVVNGITIAVYVTHLNTDPLIISEQISQIATAVSNDTATHIVMMGDWNSHDDLTYQPFINLGFSMVNRYGELNTYNGDQGWEWYMDRIFHRGFSNQGDYGVYTPPRRLGDHKPLYVDLTI
ncbi:TPA: endonuclease/exonuclease/phosphatase family protein [Citrobacter koseri]|nr:MULTISPECIES: endonuclease/exonuclease/phosphatase family protein [Citrobacter]MDM3051957.1 endonuclease/exonuclease/phosphatase family protein [Citrobacter sp. CK183]MDM9065194.1 endonuclease/exonuclease/phosphatase family protein [Citrobacter koseri]MDM9078998.1 endonuclease/exonuclease/phosphatase family protein [Citrobacter koseri]MDM9089259.1 endonuclease/exonuclease/phosphatase family protein [Citrobacter koseri]MDM9269044.1 endonuclease/exonuclease/phosphatase family protein [Citroba